VIPEAVQQQRDLNGQVAQFEGLVYTTARQIVDGGVEIDFDDVRQLLRIKILYAIQKYHSDRSTLSLRRFVFGCVRNMRKDIEKRPRRFNKSVEEIRTRHAEFPDAPGDASEWFDERFLSITAEQVYFEVEDEDPCWFARLDEEERQVVKLRSDGLSLAEIDCALVLARGQARNAMQSVREKLADWRPSAPEPRSVPMQPLPGAAARTARPRLAHAA
jgi:RNA polymerase sigma factor (sigma-70 family)